MQGLRRWCLSLVLVSGVAVAAPGDFDPAYGLAPGYTVLDFGGLDANRDVLIDAGGRAVVAATADSGSTQTAYLMRYTTSGALDTSFGVGGKAIPAVVPATYYGDVHLTRVGSNLYLIAADNTGYDLWAFNANGAPITSFGVNGRAHVALTQTYPVFGVVVQNGALLLATGALNPATNVREFVLARVTTAGQLDTTFGVGGLSWSRVYSGPTAINRLTDVKLQADGKIIAAGRMGSGSNAQNFVAARYLANGAVDTTFSGSGFAEVSVSAVDYGRRVAVQADGRVLVGGISCDIDGSGMVTNCQPRVLRFLSNGVLDTSYGSNGVFAITYNYGATALDLELDGAGRALMVGDMQMLGGQTVAYVLRLTTTGQRDTSFAGVGTKRASYGPLTGQYANAHEGIVVQGSSLYVAAGTRNLDGAGQTKGAGVIARFQN